ncbi:hypothetical protein Tco_1146649 [Tanacetum coccineum]
MRPVPPSPDRTPALYVYLLNYGDDSSDEDLSDTAKSLRDPNATRLQSSHEPMESCTIIYRHPLLSSKLPSSSRKRSRPLSPSLPPSVLPPENIESLGDNIEASI